MSPPGNGLALEVVHLKKAFGGLMVTDNVSLAIGPGERRLIIGPNGAGKTTLFNQISGDLHPNSGRIKLFGEDITSLRPYERAHRKLSRTYQIITLFPGDTIEHNVSLSLLGLRPARWHMSRPMSFYRDIASEARRTLDTVGLLHLANHPISDVAYGERRRVELAMALAQKPRVLLLDEPSEGLAPLIVAEVGRTIRRLKKEGQSIVLVEQNRQLALEVADTAVILNTGRCVFEGAASELQTNEELITQNLGVYHAHEC